MGDLLESVEAYDLGDLKVNNRFASNYNSSERAKELVRSKDLLKDSDGNGSVSQGDSDDSESETEDDDAEMLSTELDLKIIRTINSLRKKDPSIYDNTTRWFEAETATEASPVVTKDAKKKRFKDVSREQLLSTGGEEEEEEEVELSKYAGRSGAIAYDDEQRQLRKAFLQSANDSLVDEEAEASGILAVKASTTSAPPKILELRAALHEMKQLGLQHSTGRNESGKTALLELQDENEREEFLENYFSKALWKADRQFDPPGSSSSSSIIRRGGGGGGEVDQLDAPPASDCDTEDGEEVEKMEKFESKYNFRFEELQELQRHHTNHSYQGGGQEEVEGGQQSYHVVGHVRNTQGSLRRVDDKRKVERERRRERKETERRQQEAELRRLKNLKRQEMQERLKKIAAISGLRDAELGALDEGFLDEDWDPAKYEAMMENQFGDDYYEGDDSAFQGEAYGDEEAFINDADDDGYDGYDDYDDIATTDRGSSSKGLAAAAAAVRKEVDVMSDELYQLDYEDIVAGLPCRFKYRAVPAEDFGLRTEEILMADDNDLNKFVSLKKISAYNNKNGGSSYSEYGSTDLSKKRKRLRASIRDKLQNQSNETSSVEKGQAEVVEDVSDVAFSSIHTQSRDDEVPSKRKRKRRKGANILEEEEECAPPETIPAAVLVEESAKLDETASADVVPPTQRSSKEKKKRGKKNKALSSEKPAEYNRLHLYR